MAYIRVPSLAENVEVATVAKWLVTEGERVEEGQGIAEMLTEKADFILEAEIGGTVTRTFFPEKSVVPVGAVLIGLDCSDDEIARALQENEQKINTHAVFDTEQNPVGKTEIPLNKPVGKFRATPVARRLAKEHGIDLSGLAEKVGGLIREEHVRAEMDKG